MFVKNIGITNYKLFKDSFSIDFNVPDNSTIGSGLTVLCGENGNGKSSILESIALVTQDYRSEKFAIEDINNLSEKVIINLMTSQDFEVKSVLPRRIFRAGGFSFVANKRQRSNSVLYGSLVVTGRQIIPIEDQADYELRCEGTTPFGAPRYQQPSVLFLDKNRIYQTRKGNTTATNFDYLLEKLSLDEENLEDGCICELDNNHPLKRAFDKFEEKFGIPLSLYSRNPLNLMENAFVASNQGTSVIKLNNIGSGYEMFFAILWAVYRSFEVGKELIILLDEPELHLHPKLQQELISLLINISSKVQIIIATHSPLFIKQLYGINPKFHVLEKENGVPVKKDIKERKIEGFLSLNEVNFMAFGLYTEEYFNELYETLYRIVSGADENIKLSNFDGKFFVDQKGLVADKPHKANDDTKKVSYITFIRNVIHHRVDYENAGLTYTDEELKQAIDAMRSYL